MRETWQVGVLGPVTAADGEPLPRLDRYLLALLASRGGHPVTVDEITHALWPAAAPASARNRVHSLVAALRRRLSSQAIVTRAGGYQLAVEVDAAAFERLRATADIESLEYALALWRGPAYQDVPLDAVRPEAHRLDELRLDAVETLTQLRLDRCDHASVLPALQRLVTAHPTRQRLLAQLMIALYRAGRQTDALSAYRRGAAELSDEHAPDRCADLRRLHDLILRDDPSVGLRAVPEIGPAMLPTDVPAFTGRAAELARLDRLLADGSPGDRPAPAVVISAVSGTAGVGKTALAVHWAHRVAARFPDGQLYVNLRGFDPRGRAVSPAEAVRGFLDALGVPAGKIPADLDAQVAMYRSALAGKRMLVLLDNARDAEQARPLLPGSGGSVAVVTSRHQLTELVAGDGAHPIVLDVLSIVESQTLLTRRLGAGRVEAEPDAVAAIVAACARLPLALTIAAARAAQTGFALAAIAAELGDARRRLDVLDTGDAASQVRTVLSWSYAELTPPAARLFRLLGMPAGPDIGAAAAASLAGSPRAETHRLLTELTRASLLQEHAPGRYAFHYLLRDYAAELAGRVDTEDERHAARLRLLDHYAHTAHGADRLLNPPRDPMAVPLAAPVPHGEPEYLADEERAKAWLTGEHRVLLAAIPQALDAGFHTHPWQLAWGLDTLLVRRGQWDDMATAWQLASAAAGQLDPAAQGYGHWRLAFAHAKLGRTARARTELGHALDAYGTAGDLNGEAHAHRLLAFLADHPARALEHARRPRAVPAHRIPARPGRRPQRGRLVPGATGPVRRGPARLRAGPDPAAGSRRPGRRGGHLGQPRLGPPSGRPVHQGGRMLHVRAAAQPRAGLPRTGRGELRPPRRHLPCRQRRDRRARSMAAGVADPHRARPSGPGHGPGEAR